MMLVRGVRIPLLRDDAAERLGMRLNTFLQNFTRARKLLLDCLRAHGVELGEHA